MEVVKYQIVRITKWGCPYKGEKGQIVSIDKNKRKYGIQFVDSLNTFFFSRKDFAVLQPKRTR